MIRYLRRDKIDEKKWDDCIRRSFNGIIYGYAWFLDVVCEDWDALVENDYESVFPLPFKEGLGIKHIYQPFFTQQLGLFSRNFIGNDKLKSFIHEIPGSFRRIELNLNTLNKVEEGNFGARAQVNHELDLINTIDDIRSGYSQNLKRNLAKAGQNDLTISKNIRPELIVEMFRNNRGKYIRHLKDENYKKLKRLIYTTMYKGRAEVYGVYSPANDLLGGAIFLRSNKKSTFFFSGMSAQGRESGAMPFLIDRYIADHAGKHLTFDFDGSNDKNLARFYKSFGSEELHYMRLKIDRLPWYAAAGMDIARAIRKRF